MTTQVTFLCRLTVFFLLNGFLAVSVFALTPAPKFIQPIGAQACNEMEVWDYSMGMCMPLPMADMPMRMLMVHGNSFFVDTAAEVPRGKNTFAIPNMIMADIGSSMGDHQYINLDLMATAELWTFPHDGYSELLQIGEENKDHEPYVDAQHPHSSPVMGLTLSDTIAWGQDKDHVKIWFAPRGESTDGPVAFMHRPTGVVNPDAPLGHHVGQDVGHISSTVVGASLRRAGTNIEISSFHGEEPKPDVDELPMGNLNSYAIRWTQQWTYYFYSMASAAYVKHPEADEPELDHIWRYSASVYNDGAFSNAWKFHNALIYGLINDYDNASALNSFAEEFWFQRLTHNLWGRIEVLQRTPAELEIVSATPHESQWVTAVTVGYTHEILNWDYLNLGIGASVTEDFLPSDYREVYNGNPWTARVFLRINGMRMWDL